MERGMERERGYKIPIIVVDLQLVVAVAGMGWFAF